MVVSTTVYLLVTAVLCCLLSGTEGALQFEWLKPPIKSKPKTPPKNWRNVLDALLRSIEDAELQKSIKNIKESIRVGPSREMFSHCDLSILRCLKNNPIELILNGMENGTVHFDYLPDTLRFLTVESSTLNQELYIKALPASLVQLVFENVTFLSGNATVALNANLQGFTCRNCGLHSISFTGENGLKMLDLSENTLDTVPFIIPGNLTSLIMRNCLNNFSLVKIMRALPPDLPLLDLSYSQFSEFMKGIATVPPSLRSLYVSGCPINTDVSYFLNTLKSANRNVEMVVARNCGLVGKLGNATDLKLLLTLDLAHNRISEVVWRELPPILNHLDLSANAIDGTLPIKLLPRSLKSLDLSQNGFSGNFNVNELPPQLISLDVGNNNFSGTIDFARLPESIHYVYVQHNRFQGTPDLVEIPAGIRKILIHDNNWDLLRPSLSD
ncbi:leucine-rich repeat protein, putative [Trypanosoma cruzi]|nr:leucine-rich repeat protein, putative [Trypanosoma cruzi]